MSDSENSGRLSLKGDLSVGDAENIKNAMLKLLKEFPTIRINFSPLEDLDSSIIQLLYALCAQAKKESKEIIFEGTFCQSVKKRLFATGLISKMELPDETIINQISEKIRIAS